MARYEARDKEVKELEKVFRETKEALDAEKRKALFMLEKEQRNVEQLQQEKNSLRAQMQKLEQMLAEREQQIKSGARYSTSEVQQLHEEMREKQEAFDSMKKEMESYAKMQQFSQQADDSTDPAQTIELMKLQMAEMRDLLEGKVNDLKAKLADERKKIETDITQWKSMAQKELKTRLLLESERSSLQKEIQELKHRSRRLSGDLPEQTEREGTNQNRASVGSWRRSQEKRDEPLLVEPLIVEDGEPEGDGDVSIWTPGSIRRPGRNQHSALCLQCSLQ